MRHSVRGLIRAPGLTIAAVLTLALGIASTTTLLSIVGNIPLRPAPV